jgi:hypothetical protein
LAPPELHLHFVLQVPYYNKFVNIIWGGLWLGILDVTVILLASVVTSNAHQADPDAYISFMTKVSTVIDGSCYSLQHYRPSGLARCTMLLQKVPRS